MPARVHVDRLKTIYSSSKALNDGWRLRAYPDAPLQNGVGGGYLPGLLRITLRFCKQDEASAGMRKFVADELVDFANANPAVAVYAQPARQCVPTVRGEYGNGRTVHVNVSGMSDRAISAQINLLRTRSGAPIAKMMSRQASASSSIQGPWHAMMWQRPEMNTAVLPDARIATHRAAGMSATEYVQMLAEIKERSRRSGHDNDEDK